MTVGGAQRIQITAASRAIEVAHIATGSARCPIVLLHEGLGSIALWRDFPQQLATATERDVVLYSRYGHGGSEPLREARGVAYMHDEARIALRDVLATLGIANPVLFGHSDGASIALIYAATYPADVAALVLEAPHVFVEPLTVRSIAAIKTAAAQSDLLAKLGRYHDDAALTFRGWNDIWLAPDFLGWNITALLPAVRQRILLLQGADDEYGSTAQLSAIAAAVPATETELLAACGHSPHRDQAEAVLRRTQAFLANVP